LVYLWPFSNVNNLATLDRRRELQNGETLKKNVGKSFFREGRKLGSRWRLLCVFQTRVASWFVFKPKIPIWVNFGVSCYGKSWYIL
jgi:hypothetical protein